MAAGAALAISLLAACGRSEPANEAQKTAPGAEPVPRTDVYTAAIDASYPPFASLDRRGDLIGFDIDILKAVANEAGFEVRLVNTPWQVLFDSVRGGNADLAISAVTITAERLQSLDFSDPYFDAEQLIVVKSGRKLAQLNDLKPLRIGVQAGTVGDETVSRLLDAAARRIVRVESANAALSLLHAGEVDAVVSDNGVVLNHVMKQGPGLRIALAFNPQKYGIALKKGNASLLAKINMGLSRIRANGKYEEIYARYFGQLSPEARISPEAAKAVSSPSSAAN